MDDATKYIKSVYAHTLDDETINLINEAVENALADAEIDVELITENFQDELNDLKIDLSNATDEIEQLNRELAILTDDVI